MKLVNRVGRVVEIDPRYKNYFLKQGFKEVEEKTETKKRGRKKAEK